MTTPTPQVKDLPPVLDPCCGRPPVWFQWPSKRWAVQCSVCGRRGCDAPEQRQAIRFWNAELRDTESVPWFPPNSAPCIPLPVRPEDRERVDEKYAWRDGFSDLDRAFGTDWGNSDG